MKSVDGQVTLNYDEIATVNKLNENNHWMVSDESEEYLVVSNFQTLYPPGFITTTRL
jgi:hypothetical protein